MAAPRRQKNRWRRYLRYDLRSFLALVVVCGCIVGGVANVKRRYDLDQAAVNDLTKLGADVTIEPQLPKWLEKRREAWRLQWFDRAVDVRFSVDFPFDTTPPKTSPLDYGKFNTALARLRSLPRLRGLHLFGCPTSDASLSQIGGLLRLESLNLAYAPISDEGLAELAHLRKLQSLDLSHTDVTDTGVLHLHGLTQLQTLNLKSSKVSTPAARELARRLPAVSIDYEWFFMFRNEGDYFVAEAEDLTLVFEDQPGNLGGHSLTVPISGKGAENASFNAGDFTVGYDFADGAVKMFAGDRTVELRDLGQSIVAGGQTLRLSGAKPVVLIDANGAPRLESPAPATPGALAATTDSIAPPVASSTSVARWLNGALAMLGAAALAAIVWAAVRVRRARSERRLAAALKRIPGASILYDYWLAGDSAPRGPEWLKRRLPPEYFQRVAGVMLDNNKWVNDEELARLCVAMRTACVRVLNLGNTRITDASLDGLSQLRSLHELCLQGAQITPDGIQRLRKQLSRTKITASQYANQAEPGEPVVAQSESV